METHYHDPAWLSYLTSFYLFTGDSQQSYAGAIQKLLSEFAEEMRPLVAELGDNRQRAMNLRNMTADGCDKNPQSWLPPSLREYYLDPYIRKGDDGKWRLAPSIYGYILSAAIKPDGTICEDMLERPNNLSNGLFQAALVARLAFYFTPMYRYVKDKSASNQEGKVLLDAFVSRADEAGWLQQQGDVLSDPCFNYVYLHEANKKTRPSIVKRLRDLEYLDKMFTYLRLLRNVWSHVDTVHKQSSNFVDINELAQHVPNFVQLAVSDMQSISPAP